MATTREGFHVVDFILFGATIMVSLGIGLYYGCVRRQTTTKEVLLGGRSLKPLPVAASMFMSYISAVLILGNVAEMYTQGAQFWLASIGSSLAFLFAALVFVPLFHPLQLTSSFQYLELRFKSRVVKIWANVMFLVSSVVYMGLAMFTPATALEAVTDIPVWSSILASGVVATFYTTLGGMRAVVWTDTFQCLVMVAGVLAVLIGGAIEIGGLGEMWRISGEGGRLKFFDFNPDPTVRLTFWSVIFGRFFISLNYVGTGQTSVQRYSSVPTVRQAQWSALLNAPAIILVYTITCLCGLTVYAYYADKECDPLANGEIKSSNQLLPYFLMEVINYPGLPGVFLAVLFSGALSSLSSSLNSCSACLWQDLLEPCLPATPENTKVLITKALVVLFGVLSVGMAFLADGLGGHVLQRDQAMAWQLRGRQGLGTHGFVSGYQATQSLVGGAGGPSLGMFMLGSFVPQANWIGALVGGLVGFAMCTWVSVGAYVTQPSFGSLPTSLAGCPQPNITDMTTWSTSDWMDATTSLPDSEVFALYRLSYMYTAGMGCLIALVLGSIVSFITGPENPHDIDPRLLIPLFDRLCCCLPARWRHKCQCDIGYEDIKGETKDDGSKGLGHKTNAIYPSDTTDLEKRDVSHTTHELSIAHEGSLDSRGTDNNIIADDTPLSLTSSELRETTSL